MEPGNVGRLGGRRLALSLAVTVVCGAGILVGAVPASAHNFLVSSTPEAGSTISELPAEFSVTTNDNLITLGSAANSGAIEITGPDGLFYGDGCVAITGPTISTTAALGSAGEYTLAWRVVSTDGHPVTNEFTFEWAPLGDQPVTAGSATVPLCPGSDAAQAAAGQDANGSTENTVSAETGEDTGDTLLWIGGATAVIVGAIVTALLVLRRKPAERTGENERGSAGGAD